MIISPERNTLFHPFDQTKRACSWKMQILLPRTQLNRQQWKFTKSQQKVNKVPAVVSAQAKAQHEQQWGGLRSAAPLSVSSGTAVSVWVLLAIRSAGRRLRAKLGSMINSLNSHLTRRDSPGHGTLHSARSPSLPLPMRLCDIKFIAWCLNRCINITNGLQRAWNYLWVMN